MKVNSLDSATGLIKGEDKLDVFRFPLATYLTGTTFREIGKLLKAYSAQVKKQVDEVLLCELVEFLKVVSANCQALTICSLNLSDLFNSAEEHTEFMTAFTGLAEAL